MTLHKYHAQPVEIQGIRFASKREGRAFLDLKLLERAKKISGLTLQPRFPMVVNGHKICVYVADFMFIENGKTIVSDAKGMRTRDYILKRKLFLALYPQYEHRET